MAYNNYNQPMYGNYQQPTYQPITQPVQPIMQQSYAIRPNNIQYGTEEEIKAYILNPSSSVMAIDPNPDKHLMYVKSTNALGQQSFEIYALSKYEPTAITANAPTPNVNKDELVNMGFVEKKDLEIIADRLNKAEKALSTLLTARAAQPIKKE